MTARDSNLMTTCMKRPTRCLAISLSLLALNACEPADGPEPSGADEAPAPAAAQPAGPGLWAHDWRLTSIDMMDGDDLTPVEGAEAVVTFAEEAHPTGSRMLTGTTGCNRFNGAYDAGRGGRLFVSPGVAMTRMACPPPVMEVETFFMMGLEAATTYEVTDSTLTVEFGGGTLHFVAADAPSDGRP